MSNPRKRPHHPFTKVYLEHDGRRQCISDWCREMPELSQPTVSVRKRKGWTDRQCLGIDPPPPKVIHGGSLTYNGETLSYNQWRYRTGIDAMTIRYRIRFGWTEGQALGYEPPPESDDATGS